MYKSWWWRGRGLLTWGTWGPGPAANPGQGQEERVRYADAQGQEHPPPRLLALLCASQPALTACLFAGEQGAGALGVPPAAVTGAVHPPTHSFRTAPGGVLSAPWLSLHVPLGPSPKAAL